MIPGYCDCGRPSENIRVGGPCATCKKAARKAAKAAQQIRKRARIKPHSKKRAKELRAYTPLRAQFLFENPTCRINLEGCTGRATDVHHTTTSALDFLNVATWLPGCRHCHHITETVLSAEERRARGLLAG